jgi:hypothetical protein
VLGGLRSLQEKTGEIDEAVTDWNTGLVAIHSQATTAATNAVDARGILRHSAYGLEEIRRAIGQLTVVATEGDSAVFIADLREVIGEVVNNRIENLLRPHIEHQRLIWELQGWTRLPDWFVNIISASLLGKRVAFERYGMGYATARDPADRPHRWTLYCEGTFSKRSGGHTNYIAVSTVDMEPAYTQSYTAGRSGWARGSTPGAARASLGHELDGATMYHAGISTDSDEQAATDSGITPSLADFALTTADNLTAERISRIPTRCANYKSYTSYGAFLRIDILP